MEKRIILHISFWILTILLFCTVVSFRIQELMKNEVTIVIPEKQTAEAELEFPVRCLRENALGEEGIWLLVVSDGAMGQEFQAKFFMPVIVSKDKDTIHIADEGEMLRVVDYAAYPLEEGMVPEIIEKEPDKNEMSNLMKGLKKSLYLFAASVIMFLVFAWISDRLLNGIFKRKIIRSILGIVLVLAAAFCVYYSMGKVDIPRECLPEEQIFDLSFYMDRYFV